MSNVNKNVIKEYFYSSRLLLGFIISFFLALSLELTGIYLLMILAGAIAGVFIKKGWISFIVGFASVSLAWGIYFIIFSFIGPLNDLFQLIGSIIGVSGSILMILSIIIGGLLGGTGALVGAFIMQLILGEKFNTKQKIKLF